MVDAHMAARAAAAARVPAKGPRCHNTALPPPPPPHARHTQPPQHAPPPHHHRHHHHVDITRTDTTRTTTHAPAPLTTPVHHLAAAGRHASYVHRPAATSRFFRRTRRHAATRQHTHGWAWLQSACKIVWTNDITCNNNTQNTETTYRVAQLTSCMRHTQAIVFATTAAKEMGPLHWGELAWGGAAAAHNDE